jgi:hypothetical protein
MTDQEFFLQCVGKSDDFTIGDLCSAVLEIKDRAKAARFYRGYVRWLRKRRDLEASAENVAKTNIGWVFGEGMSPIHQRMWYEVVGAEHPVFGTTLASNNPPTYTEKLESGMRIGKASKEGKMREQIGIERERFQRHEPTSE